MSEALPNLPEYSVSELSAALKRAVEENFPFVRVRGEISGLKLATSGHTYFDLKDDKALINAIIWKQTARAIPLRPEAGLEVVCTGRVTTYPGSSRYQIIVEQMELAGAGALMAMLEELKKRLAAEGLFAAERKKKLPFLPELIGVITSPTGAVLRDIMHRLAARFPRPVLLWPVAVQGEKAAGEIAAAITGFNELAFAKPDLLIVARGGGSIEDLMAFNDEAVVRAAAASGIPLISAVGHETDTTLIDFAADIRAPTPTAAAELAVPVRAELLGQTMDFERRSLSCFSRGLEQRRRHLTQLSRVLPRPEALFATPRQRLDLAGGNLGKSLAVNLRKHDARLAKAGALLRPATLNQSIVRLREKLKSFGERTLRCERAHLKQWRSELEAASRVLDGVSYRKVLERGFALVKGEGHVRRRAEAIRPGENLTLVFADGEAAAVAAGKPAAARGKKPGSPPLSLFERLEE